MMTCTALNESIHVLVLPGSFGRGWLCCVQKGHVQCTAPGLTWRHKGGGVWQGGRRPVVHGSCEWCTKNAGWLGADGWQEECGEEADITYQVS